jgi:hypothetical protein
MQIKHYIFLLLSIVFLNRMVSAQSQVIGAYPGMDGGFENSSVGAVASNSLSTSTGLQSTVWTTSSSGLATIKSTLGSPGTPRTGNKCLSYKSTSTTKRVQSPTAADGLVQSATPQIVQFYYRTPSTTAPACSLQVGAGSDAYFVAASFKSAVVSATGTNNAWVKVAAACTSTTSAASPKYGIEMIRFVTGAADTVSLDDVVMYPGTTPDETAPDIPTDAVQTSATSAALGFSWSAPATGVDGGGYIVVRSLTDPSTTPNVNGVYAVGNTVAAGQTVVYLGTDPSFTDNGLTHNVKYYYRIYTVDKAFNYSAGLTYSDSTVSQSLSAEPTTQTSSITFSNIQQTSLTINWAKGNGTNRIVLVKSGAAVDGTPTDGVTYSSSTTYGSGTSVGTSYVVYNGTGDSVNVTGLTKATRYYVSVYEFNGSAGSENYLATSPATGNQTSSATTVYSNGTGGGVWSAGASWAGGVAPTSSDNAVIVSGDRVVVGAAAGGSAFNVTVNTGGVLTASGTNISSSNSFFINVYGTTITANDTMGTGTDGLSFNIYNSNATITGSSPIQLSQLRPQVAAGVGLTIDANVTMNYKAGAASTGRSLILATGTAPTPTTKFSSITINAGKSLNFNDYSSMCTASSASTDWDVDATITVNGALNAAGPGAEINIRSTAGHTVSLIVNGTASIRQFYPANNALTNTINITVNSGGTFTAAVDTTSGVLDLSYPGVVISGAGTFNIGQGATVNIGSPNGLNSSTGPIRTTTRNFSTLASYYYNASSAQATGADLPSTVNNLSINNASGVTLTKSTLVNGTLGLVTGKLTLGASNLTLANSYTGTGASSKMIITSGAGELRKLITALPTTFLFPVGTDTTYTPAKVTITAGTLSSAYIGVKSSATKSSHNSSATNYLNRTWTLTSNGITDPVHTDTLTYGAPDVAGTEASLVGGLYNGSSWTSLGSVNAATHQIAGTLTGFGEITAGEFATAGHVQVKAVMQGFYNAGGYLNSQDTIRILLANITSPYAVVDSADAILDSLTYLATGTFSAAANGTYYVIVKHRSSVETWSAEGVAYTSSGTVSYDFTSAASQAYGGNEVEVTSGVFALYSGDCNQDGYVDPLDLSLVDQDSYNYVAGVALATDVNGDLYVDPLDLSVVDQNSYNYVGIQRPSAGRVISAKERAANLPYYRNWLLKKASK